MSSYEEACRAKERSVLLQQIQSTPLQAYYCFVAIGQMAAMALANSALASPCAVTC